MAILVSAHQISKSFGARPLFDGLTFSIESNERIGLIGPNGAGKSTLLRILAGQTSPDSGTLSLQRGLRVGFLEQVPTFSPGATVFQSVIEGSKDPHDWQEMSLAHEILAKLDLTSRESDPIESLSGGWKKRVALAREFVRSPDLMLLDEPTNHLDVESILWLESYLERARFSVLTITHDRAFLQKVSNRIIELDRRNPGGLLSIQGDYAKYVETKSSVLEAQQSQELRLRNTLRRETEWLRQGAKARTTKQQARIQRAEELETQVSELRYRNQTGSVQIDFESSDKNPKKLIEAKGISKGYSGKTVLPKQDLLITPKTRLGLLGANGCGKSTLIRILMGTEMPDTGTVFRSEHLQVAYFEQNRESLDPEQTVAKTLCPVGDFVIYRGKQVHIRGYLERFLFDPAQKDMAVGKLSGGEQSRLLIAQLMLQEANVLVLDEPTNDLDISTLDVLQEVLQEFNGAVILVTHDRYFLDQVCNQILAFGKTKGQPVLMTFTDVQQWTQWHDQHAEFEETTTPIQSTTTGSANTSKPKKLSFKDQRELDQMEKVIQEREARLHSLAQESAKPELATHAPKLAELAKEMATLQSEIDRLYTRWNELEKMTR